MIAAAAAASAMLSPAPASAQGGLFDLFFGSRRPAPPPSASAYSDPYPSVNSHGGRGEERRTAGPSGSSGVFCVRLCDGRYFPVQRANGANAAQLCSSFCPAAETRVFSGGGIDHASASDGTRYSSLRNAFAYRERIVENCTCNGRDAYGLVPLDAATDPTLRNGDIVATNEGFVAFNGSNRRQAEFTPIQSYPGLSTEWRERLAETRITPNATPVSAETIREGASNIYDERGRRVQLR